MSKRLPIAALCLTTAMAAIVMGAPAQVAFAEDTAPQTATTGDFAGLVDIGGRRLYLACQGSGTPTVILEAGAGNNGDIWSEVEPDATSKTSVFDGVASFTRVCAHHRPGTIAGSERSRSDPVPMPRDAAAIVADLRALLTAAAVRPPYVLVGHSFGGLIARLLASGLPPDDVVGLVLVDAAQEDFWTKLKAVVTPEQWKLLTTFKPQEFADYRDFEVLDVNASENEMRKAAAAKPLRPLPIVVLSRGLAVELPNALTDDLPPNYSHEQERIWQETQEKLVKLVPGAKHVIATKSGHYIQTMQPDLVIDAVRQVVDAARQGSAAVTPD